MPNKQELLFRLSEQAQQGLPHHTFPEVELRAFLSIAPFDGSIDSIGSCSSLLNSPLSLAEQCSPIGRAICLAHEQGT